MPETDHCPDCGRVIFCSGKYGFDDASSFGYVTMAGDLKCIPCGRADDEAMSKYDSDFFGEEPDG